MWFGDLARFFADFEEQTPADALRGFQAPVFCVYRFALPVVVGLSVVSQPGRIIVGTVLHHRIAVAVDIDAQNDACGARWRREGLHARSRCRRL